MRGFRNWGQSLHCNTRGKNFQVASGEQDDVDLLETQAAGIAILNLKYLSPGQIN
jgi:hypothetical protein